MIYKIEGQKVLKPFGTRKNNNVTVAVQRKFQTITEEKFS